MADLSVFLRDFHSGAQVDIDIGVIDFLAAIMSAVGSASATILSAYRTPETNAMLARTMFGVAENSQHMYGRALDLHLETPLAAAMSIARSMRRGGVGWYPHSGFMHIDSGPVRNWDLDSTGLGSLLFDGKRVRFNNSGELLISEGGGRRLPLTVFRGTTARGSMTVDGLRPTTVKERLARLHQLAQAEFYARGGVSRAQKSRQATRGATSGSKMRDL